MWSWLGKKTETGISSNVSIFILCIIKKKKHSQFIQEEVGLFEDERAWGKYLKLAYKYLLLQYSPTGVRNNFAIRRKYTHTHKFSQANAQSIGVLFV